MNKLEKDKMLRAFRGFASRISTKYDEAADALERGDYLGAHRILSQLTQSHAKTSLSLRNKLVREGLLRDSPR